MRFSTASLFAILSALAITQAAPTPAQPQHGVPDTGLSTKPLDPSIKAVDTPKNFHQDCDSKNPQCKMMNKGVYHSVNESEGHLGKQAGIGANAASHIAAEEHQKDLSKSVADDGRVVQHDLQGRKERSNHQHQEHEEGGYDISGGLRRREQHDETDSGAMGYRHGYMDEADYGDDALIQKRQDEYENEMAREGQHGGMRQFGEMETKRDGMTLVGVQNSGNNNNAANNAGNSNNAGTGNDAAHGPGQGSFSEDPLPVKGAEVPVDITDAVKETHEHKTRRGHSQTNKELKMTGGKVYPGQELKNVGGTIHDQGGVVRHTGNGVDQAGREADKQFDVYGNGYNKHGGEFADAIVN